MSESNETLKAVLREMGIDDVDQMDSDDIVLLARTLGIETPSGADLGEGFDQSGHEYEMEQEADDEESNDLDNAFVADESTLANAMSDLNSQSAVVDTSSAETEDNSHDDIISTFCAITGSDPVSAGHFLEAFGWDLEGAIPMYLENAQQGNANSITAPTDPSTTRSRIGIGIQGQSMPVHSRFSYEDSEDDSLVRPPGVGRPMEGLGGDDNDIVMPPLPAGMLGTGAMYQQHFNSILQNMMRSSMGMPSSEDSDSEHPLPLGGTSGGIASFMAAYDEHLAGGASGAGAGRRQPDRYDEDGVRLPDPVQRQRLMPTGRNYRGDDDDDDQLRHVMGRAEDPTVEWMFPPPRHLSSQLSLEKARAQAHTEGRWLLVNLQSHEQFASHMLNRDTWPHETMESVLRTTFLLWQRGHTSGEGADYMRMHRLHDDDLPHIGVIDPRTGAKLLTLTGFVSPDDLLIRLMEFADRNLLTVPKISTTGSTASGKGSSVATIENVSSATSNATSGNNSGNTSTTNLPSLAEADAKLSSDDNHGTSGAKYGHKGEYRGNNKDSESSPAATTAAERMMTDRSSAGEKTASASASGSVATRTLEGTGQTLGGTAVSSEMGGGSRDYGSIPPEPAEGAADSVKVSIKLSNGKALARRYLKNTPVSALFAVAAAADDATQHKAFDLMTRFPVTSLSSCLEKTLEECSLAGSQLILKIA